MSTRFPRRPIVTQAVFATAFLFTLCVAPAVLRAESTKRPNIVLILADDLGFSDLGCYGGEIQTPNLDALADNGLRFTQFYNTGRCWPTRGSMLTGYYAQQIRRDFLPGVPSGGGNRGLRPDWAVLLPQMLSQVGYRSYHTGKWHIDSTPTKCGFDKTSLNQVGRYFSPKLDANEKPKQPLEFRDDEYLTSSMADDAVENLKEHAAQHAEEPFFQYLAFTAPHFPLHALPEDIAVYADTYTDGWDSIRKQRWQRMQAMGILDPETANRVSSVERDLGPPYHFPEAFEILGEGETNRPVPWNQLTDKQKSFQATKMAIHAAMVHRMDIAIGRVLDQVRSMGCWDDTIVMFLSDNGASAEIMVRGDGHDPNEPPGSALTYLCLGPGWSTTCNTPFRRHKTWTHEGGIATPFIVSWPNRIKDDGQFRRNPQHVIDVAATLLELTGATHPDGAPAPPGISFLADLDAQHSAEERTLWWYHDGHRAIRQGRWKAVSPVGEPWELYDLSNDRIESVDLALPHAEKLAELVAAWEKQLAESVELATEDLSAQDLSKGSRWTRQSDVMSKAQQAGRIKRSQVLPGGETFFVADRHAFLMKPDSPAKSKLGMPWIFYAPALSRYPDKHEQWMHRQFLNAGIAVAGIDVGEAYGSPHSQPFFDALYDEMVSRGYSTKPALLGRSRGGLYVSRFAIERPERVAAIGGIYPVLDYTSYPGVERAAPVYGVTPEALEQRQQELNPAKNLNVVAEAGIPVYVIHGTEDRVVPIERNSAVLESAYKSAGNEAAITLERVDGQGHNFWEGFFRSQKLVDFVIDAAKGD
ncbi:Arylsulfatase [Stieleria maiorica]|uniref:Arylsulfatase n=1 Tax=Stieleria maiorica TaxID=2795974 RepID=A0A5B9MBU8_9BACT|nr:sulfatase-like hydrolase/transferase [Stieleria maiorica]QEF98478.1 Arylsulfatase [Stieleria maiorica]